MSECILGEEMSVQRRREGDRQRGKGEIAAIQPDARHVPADFGASSVLRRRGRCRGRR